MQGCQLGGRSARAAKALEEVRLDRTSCLFNRTSRLPLVTGTRTSIDCLALALLL